MGYEGYETISIFPIESATATTTAISLRWWINDRENAFITSKEFNIKQIADFR